MAGRRKERFWRGLILTRSHARKVIDLTAGFFLLMAGLGLLTAILTKVDASTIATPLLFGIPAWFLQSKKSLIAAWVLFGISAVAVLLTVAVAAGVSVTPNNRGLIVIMFPVALFWAVLMLATWRACKATKVLRALPPDETAITTLSA